MEEITARWEFRIYTNSRIWAVLFLYKLERYNYSIWNGGELVETGITDKPFTMNAAKVLLIDHLEKIHIDEKAKKDGDGDAGMA